MQSTSTYGKHSDPHLVLDQHVLGIDMRQGSKILEYGNQRLHTKADLPEVPRTSKNEWVRASDPHASHTTLRKESRLA